MLYQCINTKHFTTVCDGMVVVVVAAVVAAVGTNLATFLL